MMRCLLICCLFACLTPVFAQELVTPSPGDSPQMPVSPSTSARRDVPRGALLLSVGSGGKYDVESVSAEYILPPVNAQGVKVGFGLAALLTSTDSPDDILAGPPPHGSYQHVGEFRNTAFALYGTVGRPIAGDLMVRGLVGFSSLATTQVAQSDLTGWYYSERVSTEVTFMFGGGLVYRNVAVNYDNVRGISLGLAIPL